MEQNKYEAYSTQLLNINPAGIDWKYILKDDKVVELLDGNPEESQDQIRELFYKTMIGISLYFQSKKGKDLETIKLHYPKLPTLIKELIKEGVNKGELYVIDCLYSKDNARTHKPATADIVGSDGVRIYVNTELNHARLYAEYENKLPAYVTATADIVMELDKLDGDTSQPAKGRGKRGRPTNTFAKCLICADDKKSGVLELLHHLIDGTKGQHVALVITAATDAGAITKPNSTQVREEFGEIGNRSGYNNQKRLGFTKSELDPIIEKFKAIMTS